MVRDMLHSFPGIAQGLDWTLDLARCIRKGHTRGRWEESRSSSLVREEGGRGTGEQKDARGLHQLRHLLHSGAGRGAEHGKGWGGVD